MQDKTTVERAMFDTEMVPQELTQVRVGKIVGEKYPQLDDNDKEAVRQYVVAAVNATQEAQRVIRETLSVAEPGVTYTPGEPDEPKLNTAFVDGVRKFAMDVRELSVDLIDSINPFGEAYNILAKTMSKERLRQLASVIAAKRINLTEEEIELAERIYEVDFETFGYEKKGLINIWRSKKEKDAGKVKQIHKYDAVTWHWGPKAQRIKRQLKAHR